MARTYDTQALLNSTYLSKEHHADFRTALKVECWLLYLVDLIREGKDIPKPPVDWISDYWDAQIPPATEAAPSLGDGQPKSAGTWDWYGCLDPAALGSRSPLELLLEGWETHARLLNENARAEEDEQAARYYAARAAELTDCIQALRAQAEAVLRVGQAARELMERSEQPEHTCNWSYGRGAKEALEDIRAALAQADAVGGTP